MEDTIMDFILLPMDYKNRLGIEWEQLILLDSNNLDCIILELSLEHNNSLQHTTYSHLQLLILDYMYIFQLDMQL